MKILKLFGKIGALALGGAALVAAGKSGLGRDLFTGGKDDDEPMREPEDDFVEATEVTEVPAEETEPEPTATEVVEEDS